MTNTETMADDANVRCNRMIWKKILRTSLRNAHHAKYLTFFMKQCYTVTLLLKGCAAI